MLLARLISLYDTSTAHDLTVTLINYYAKAINLCYQNKQYEDTQ